MNENVSESSNWCLSSGLLRQVSNFSHNYTSLGLKIFPLVEEGLLCFELGPPVPNWLISWPWIRSVTKFIFRMEKCKYWMACLLMGIATMWRIMGNLLRLAASSGVTGVCIIMYRQQSPCFFSFFLPCFFQIYNCITINHSHCCALWCLKMICF